MDRRAFLASTGALLSAAAFARVEAFAAAEPATAPLSAAGIGPEGWRTLGLVQEHLLPSEAQAPGAREINALRYLHFVMGWQGTDPAEPRILHWGLERLREIVAQAHGGVFEALDTPARERALRALEAEEDGTQWLLLVLDYLFEALLADPIYGGNPDGIGWRWLRVEPGHHRPGPDQRYFELMA
ncbi:MAG: gluconate 2-dehydrogenase subunit 3 family protein [Candidatus Thiosymbion ectosymbiont of Robbea hypermnestra]|nr:gluconate 2-dehydrogenase subunit 3 family protein [Candidatus Thiosymbion ectosymbiont of Robbea hypermnestra]